MSKKDETQEGTRCEFVFDDYTLKVIQDLQDELGISTRKDAVKRALYFAHEHLEMLSPKAREFTLK